MTPVLSFGICRNDADGKFPSVLDAGESLLLTSGRAAIAVVIQMLGVRPGDKVLLPAFHCKSMLDPITQAGADAILYEVNIDLSANLADIESKLSNRSQAIIAVHYFGFPQDMRALRKLCDKHQIALIEDCAHSFFGSFDGSPPGCIGDYAIASVSKFFPVADGGCVVSSKHGVIHVGLPFGGIRFELKSLVNSIELAIGYRRLRPFNLVLTPLVHLKDFFWNATKLAMGAWQRSREEGKTQYGGHRSGQRIEGRKISWWSRFVLRRASIDRVTTRRRRNYRYYAKTLDGLDRCHSLFPNLPDTVVPYIFPLVIDDPDKVFDELKRQAIPMYRWEEVPAGACPISARYSRHLIQLPCHQELRPGELDIIVNAIRSAVGDAKCMLNAD